MRSKRFQIEMLGRRVVVEAEREGDARYMARMRLPDEPVLAAPLRIGYLTGEGRTWVAEFFGGKRPALRAGSAKEACTKLAAWALQQPGVASLLKHGRSMPLAA